MVEVECACADGAGDSCLCQHIDRYYSHRFPEPVVYWTFDPGILEPTDDDDPKWAVRLVDVRSDTGDDCHRNIHGFSDNRANRILKRHVEPAAMTICTNGEAEPFSWDRMRELVA